MDYYVVWVGKEPGIYDNWTDCRNQIHQFKGAYTRNTLLLRKPKKLTETLILDYMWIQNEFLICKYL